MVYTPHACVYHSSEGAPGCTHLMPLYSNMLNGQGFDLDQINHKRTQETNKKGST